MVNRPFLGEEGRRGETRGFSNRDDRVVDGTDAVVDGEDLSAFRHKEEIVGVVRAARVRGVFGDVQEDLKARV